MRRCDGLGSILVLGNFRPAFSVIRTLTQTGYRTILGLWGGEGYVEFSRHVHEVWDHPPISDNGDEFIRALQQFIANRPDIGIIYPIAEVFVICLAEHTKALPSNVLIASVASSIVKTCIDKQAMLEIAATNNVSLEPFKVVNKYREIFIAAKETGYPAVIRPITSIMPIANKKALVCATEDDIRCILPSWPPGQRALLIQHRAQGVRHNIYFAAHQGRIIRSLETIILRTDRFDETGYAVDAVTVPRTVQLHKDCARLVYELKYSGVGAAQFIFDKNTGRSCFLELNPRLGGNYAITEKLGQQLTRLAISLSNEFQPTEKDFAFDYPSGIRYVWTYGDFRGLKNAIVAREVTPRQSIVWFSKACYAFMRADVHLTWSSSDPLPALLLFARQIPGLGFFCELARRFIISRKSK